MILIDLFGVKELELDHPLYTYESTLMISFIDDYIKFQLNFSRKLSLNLHLLER